METRESTQSAADQGESSSPSVRTPIEVSVVMPCLNEADTLGQCIEKAQRALQDHGISGEIIIADNGSTDASISIAREAGVRVVHVPERGYGAALMGGIAAARGTYIIMGDADDSYDFSEIPRFVHPLREGFDLVMGCRLAAGGGKVLPGAMPPLHRWIGNPVFSRMAHRMFGTPIHDVYCGLRGFAKQSFEQLDARCTGMEFATEMVIKSSLFRQKIAEVPITLQRDGRKHSTPHLRTFRDGWRTLRFFAMYSPRWLYLVPGLILFLMGIAGYAVALPGFTILGATFDAHTLLFASLFLMMGYQAILFAFMAKVFATGARLLPEDPRLLRAASLASLERVLLVSLFVFLVGLLLLTVAVFQWWETGFGRLDYARTMRWVVPGITLAALGFQSMLASFFVSIMRLRLK